jgi:hypothetical protein
MTSKKPPKRASAKGADVVRVATSPNTSMENFAMDPKMTMQVPEAVREAAEKAVEQTEKAFDVFLSAANQSVAMMPSPATDISKKDVGVDRTKYEVRLRVCPQVAPREGHPGITANSK